MFDLSPATPFHPVDDPATESSLFTVHRVDQWALQVALASATLSRLERYAERTTCSLRHELVPHLKRLRTIETRCTEWLAHPQAQASPSAPKAVTLLEDETDALEALSEGLSPQAFTHHLQQRGTFVDRSRAAMRLLPRDEWYCEPAMAYFDALLRLDTTGDVQRLPNALADLQAAADQFCAFVASRREAHRCQTVERSASRPSEQCPGIARLVLDRRRRLPVTVSAMPLSGDMSPSHGASRRPRTDAPGPIPASATREILRFLPYR